MVLSSAKYFHKSAAAGPAAEVGQRLKQLLHVVVAVGGRAQQRVERCDLTPETALSLAVAGHGYRLISGMRSVPSAMVVTTSRGRRAAMYQLPHNHNDSSYLPPIALGLQVR